jgi:peptidoglycan/LPS O-acetylase OafA/YrhL
MAQSKLDFVDVLRGLAILGVVWLHFTGMSGMMNLLPESLQFVVEQGGHGVQLFFIASAFTLFRSYHHRSALEATPVRNFFIRRYFRIAPMYYVGIAYYLFQNGFGPTKFLDGTFQNTPANILANVFFVHEFNPYYLWLVPGSWSIATEMMFYLLVPLLFRWIPDMRSAIRFLGFGIVVRVISWYGVGMLPWIPDPMVRDIYAGWILPTQLPIFGLGILLFFILRGDAWPKLGKWDLLFWAGLVFAEVLSQGGRILQSEFVLGVAFALMAVGFSHLSWSHLLGKVLRHIGKVSFSLYVVHWGVMHWMHHFGLAKLGAGLGWGQAGLGYAWRFALMLGASVLVSTITFELIEQPGQKLGGRIIARWDRRTQLSKTS